MDAALPIPADLLADKPMAPFNPSTLVAACKRQRDPIWWRFPVPPARNTIFADIIEDEPRGVRWHTPAETDRLLGRCPPEYRQGRSGEACRQANGRRTVRRIRPDANGKRVQRAEVRFDDVAGCLRVPTGGSSRQTIVIVEGDSVKSRLLSPGGREV